MTAQVSENPQEIIEQCNGRDIINTFRSSAREVHYERQRGTIGEKIRTSQVSEAQGFSLKTVQTFFPKHY